MNTECSDMQKGVYCISGESDLYVVCAQPIFSFISWQVDTKLLQHLGFKTRRASVPLPCEASSPPLVLHKQVHSLQPSSALSVLQLNVFFSPSFNQIPYDEDNMVTLFATVKLITPLGPLVCAIHQ